MQAAYVTSERQEVKKNNEKNAVLYIELLWYRLLIWQNVLLKTISASFENPFVLLKKI